MILRGGKIFDLLDPLAKGISDHIKTFDYLNKYELTFDEDNFFYMNFSTEGWSAPKHTKADNYIKSMLSDYSFNIQGWSNKKNSKTGGFGNHDEITVIFEKANLLDNKKELQILSKSFSVINKFQL